MKCLLIHFLAFVDFRKWLFLLSESNVLIIFPGQDFGHTVTMLLGANKAYRSRYSSLLQLWFSPK
jgi:hypothetical protein